MKTLVLLVSLALVGALSAAEFEKHGGEYIYRDTLVFEESALDVTLLECESVNGETNVTGEERASVYVRVFVEIKTDDLEDGQKYLKDFRPVVERSGSKIRAYGEYPETNWSWNDISANMDFEIRAPKALNLTASAANGEINCTGMSGAAELDCANGEIKFISESGSTGAIEASTANGEILVDVAELNATSEFSCANGEIKLVVRKLLAGDVSASTANGEIVLAFPENASMEVMASSVINGTIRSDWEGTPKDNLVGDEFEFAVNGGKYKVECSSANGEIEIRKSNHAD